MYVGCKEALQGASAARKGRTLENVQLCDACLQSCRLAQHMLLVNSDSADVFFCREHEPLPLSMQYFLLNQSKVEQCIQQFDVDRRHDVVLMVMADPPEREVAARDSLLKVQQTDLPSRHEALHKAVADLKVLYVDT